MAGRTHPHQGHSFRHPSRPHRCHKGPRPVSSRRRTCADRKHRPRWDQADRRQLCALAGAPDGWTVACAADSPWPPPAILRAQRQPALPNLSRPLWQQPEPRGGISASALSCRPAERAFRTAVASGGTAHASCEFRLLGTVRFCRDPRVGVRQPGWWPVRSRPAARGRGRSDLAAQSASNTGRADILRACAPPRRAVQPHRRCRGRARRLQ